MVGGNWLPVFRRAAKAVSEAIGPFVGTERGGKTIAVKAGGDVTRKIDAVADEVAISVLQEHSMDFTLISEESGSRTFGKKRDGTVILDPVDGSANAVRGIPAYSFSIAFAKGNRLSDICEALVVDLPNGIFYEGELHKGANCNGDAISPSKVEKLSESMIGADLNIVDLRTYTKRILRVLNIARRKRYLGTNALEICLVACGKYDAFVDLRGVSRVTDVAAAYLILKEAGGMMVDERGIDVDAELLPTSRLSFVAAANPTLCKSILLNLRTDM